MLHTLAWKTDTIMSLDTTTLDIKGRPRAQSETKRSVTAHAGRHLAPAHRGAAAWPRCWRCVGESRGSRGTCASAGAS
jgi:hypothetical protein